MKLNKLIDKLLELQKKGYGKHDVCYLYGEAVGSLAGERQQYHEVRDTIKKVAVADPADGKEIHLWQ